MKTSPLKRIARTSYRRRRAVVLGWVGLLIALFALSSSFGGELRNDFSIPNAESDEASQLLEDGGLGNRGGYAGQIVFSSDEGVDAPAVRSAMEALFADITAEVPEVGIVSPYSDEGRIQVAPGGQVAFAEVQFGDISTDEATGLADEIVEVRSSADLPGDLQVELGGDVFYEHPEFSSEAFGFLAAMVILLIAFGSVLAMGLPLVTALFGIGTGLGGIMLAANLIDIPEFGPQSAMLVCIGVGIDYALLIVTRFREELRGGREPEEAVVTAMATAGRAVFFAGTTVVIAMAGLLLGGVPVFRTLAVTVSLGVLMVLAATLTLVPALLGFAGRNIDRLNVHRRRSRGQVKDPRSTVWYRLSRVVQRRPGPIAATITVALLLLAAPVFAMQLGFGDAGNRPTGETARRAYDLLSDSFGPGYNGPLFLAADLPGDAAEDAAVLEALGAGLEADPGVAMALPPFTNEAGDVGVVQVFPTTSPQDADTFDTVDRLRDQVVPQAVEGTSADVLVGGMPAGAVDFGQVQTTQLPVFIGAVLVLSFLLLLAVFRSILVAVKAVILNTLSIGAAYGAVIAVFQWGWGADLLGLGEPGPVEAWAPLALFAIVFGLSIDYEVFLLSRIKEEYEATGDTSTAVADGLAKTARLITAAAAIMVCVSGGFVLSADRGLQMFGLGLAVAIFVDAALIRTLLVPSTMELLGDRNWWLPGWLDRILPRLDIEGTALPESEAESEPDVAVPGNGDRDRPPREPQPA